MTALRLSGAGRWLKPALGLLVTLAFLWLIARQVDAAALAGAFTGLAPAWLLLALALLAADYALRILRWWWMLRSLAPALPARACAWPYLASIAVNNVLPFRAGDVLRAFGFRRQLQSPAMRVLGTLVLERLLDMTTLLALFFVGLLAVPTELFPRAITLSAAWLAGTTALTLAALLLLAPRLPAMMQWVAEQPALAARGWSERIGHWGQSFAESFGILRRPADVLALFGLSFAIWLLEAALFAVIALAFAAPSGPLGGLFAMATGTLSTLIPSSPGYVGTFDYFTLTAFAAYGVPEADAAAIAFTVHAVLWLPLTVLGLGWLALRGRGLLARAAAARAEQGMG
jgi:glycosyltransferase 2 family protein